MKSQYLTMILEILLAKSWSHSREEACCTAPQCAPPLLWVSPAWPCCSSTAGTNSDRCTSGTSLPGRHFRIERPLPLPLPAARAGEQVHSGSLPAALAAGFRAALHPAGPGRRGWGCHEWLPLPSTSSKSRLFPFTKAETTLDKTGSSNSYNFTIFLGSVHIYRIPFMMHVSF